MDNNLKNIGTFITLIGLGIILGSVVTIIFINVLGFMPSKVNVGAVEYVIPSATSFELPQMTQQSELPQMTQQSSVNTVVSLSASNQIPTEAFGMDSPTIQSGYCEKFLIELKGCKRFGDMITCGFIVTNPENEDRNFELGNCARFEKSKLYDDLGNDYEIALSQIADMKDNCGGSETLLISHLPVRASIWFEGVNPKATKAAMLHIGCWTDVGDFTLEFREIPLE